MPNELRGLRGQLRARAHLRCACAVAMGAHVLNVLRRNPIEDGAISGFSGQKSVPE